jgi:uncharacterized protein YdeI (YjbR/CyaY-like superfamily)
MPSKEIETFCPASRQQWRQWLKTNHIKKQSVNLILYKKESNKPTISWSEAVDEALCFGWVDSTRRPLDEEKFMQFFSKRKPAGTWSKINKEKITQLIEKGLMTQAGLDCIEKAKQNGSWAILDEVEELIIPKDLEKAFKLKPGSKKHFLGLSKSVRKFYLHQVMIAKRPETREKRINDIVCLAAEKKKA